MQCAPGTRLVTYCATYYCVQSGVHAKTLRIDGYGEQSHSIHTPADIARTFLPMQEAVARRYLLEPGRLTAKNFTDFLVHSGLPKTSLPAPRLRSQWLKNHKTKGPRGPTEAPRAEVVRRFLEDWPDAAPDTVSDIFLPNSPPRTLTERRVCIPMACKGMIEVMRRYNGGRVSLLTDMKQNCMAHGWGVLTMSFLVKDHQRYTNLGRIAKRRVQGRVYTSHAVPVMQAILHCEETDNIIQAFETLKRLWGIHFPDRQPLEDLLDALHKDYLPALEAARRQAWKQSRPVNDFFHLTQKYPLMEAKLKNLEAQGGKFVKRDMPWVKFSLHNVRHLPSPDLYSAIWEGWFRRLQAKDELVLGRYFGIENHSTYTVRASVAELKARYGVKPLEPDDEVIMLFSPHWSGIFGLWPGSDCGDQPQEAFHSPWQAQVEVLGKRADATQVLHTMQTLYNHQWAEQCQWNSNEALCTSPPKADSQWLTGPLLGKLGRTTGTEFWDLKDKHTLHYVHDASEHLQIMAVSRVATMVLDVDRARLACSLVVSYGAALTEGLRIAGVLKDLLAVTIAHTYKTPHITCKEESACTHAHSHT